MRGDNVRAKEQYEVVNKYGNSELKKTTESNKKTADEINERMKNDPEQRKQLYDNIITHSKLEEDVNRIFKDIGRGVEGLVNDIFRKK